MPPKKGPSGKKEKDGKNDKINIEQVLLDKDLEIETLLDKVSRLEKRSETLVSLTEQQQVVTKDMVEKLQDIVSFLTSDVKKKEVKIQELELTLKNLREESTKTIDGLARDFNELKSTHKFVTDDLRLQLAHAQVQLRDIDDFRAKKTAIEQEIAGLKETIEKQKKDHQDAMSDIERAALQAKERLKKEMAMRIEETKTQMLKQMDDQLHAKTKRTMVENEKLGKELGYHIRQTELIFQKHEKLVQENIELHRQVLLAKEVHDDLVHRNRMNQKTIRILLYKLRERYKAKADKSEKEQKQPHNCVANVEVNQDRIPETSAPTTSTEEVLKFLYACLEEVKAENISGFEKGSTSENIRGFPSSLNSDEERHDFLVNLLQAAISHRALPVVDEVPGQSKELCPTTNDVLSSKQAVSFDDILKLPVLDLHANNMLVDSIQSDVVSISSSAQTEGMDLEERLVSQIRERLHACSAVDGGTFY